MVDPDGVQQLAADVFAFVQNRADRGCVDAGIDERGRQVLGEVFQVVGEVLPGAGRKVQIVDFIDDDEICSSVSEDLADGFGDVGDVVAWPDRWQAQEAGELHCQLARGSPWAGP